MKKRPYLSIVIAARNDNYGGDFNQRIQNFISWNTNLLEKYKLETEIIIVNWNPIEENLPLSKTLEFPKNRNFVTYRIITVPNEIHQKFVDTTIRKTVPLFEFIAKNVGIKRAESDFVLSSNADILFSEELISSLAKKSLETNVLYRSTRVDFKKVENNEISENEIKKNATSFFLKGGNVAFKLPLNFNSKLLFYTLYNHLRKIFYYIVSLVPFQKMLHKEELFFLKHHCNACGDFALMDKALWNTFPYRENTWISTHTDSLHVVDVVSNNIQINESKYNIYHQEHARRYVFNNEDTDIKKMFNYIVKTIRIHIFENIKTPQITEWGINQSLKETAIE